MSLVTDLIAVCDQILAEGPDEAAAEAIRSVRRRLDQPVRVAIAGRVKAGKSTLLNALVGEPLAATDAGECTRIVTWYEHDLTYRVTASLIDGSDRELPFDRSGGRLDIDLDGLAEEEIMRLVVGWPAAVLETITLIDTPGLGSLSAVGERTEAMIADHDVDAVLYLMRHLHATDAEFLEAFRDAATESTVNAIGVLSRADEIGGARSDAMESARRIAARYTSDDRVGALVGAVVAVNGLTAASGRGLRESEATTLAEVAALGDRERSLRLASADRFAENPKSRDALTRLGLYGVRRSVAELSGGNVRGAGELSAFLVGDSGIGEVEDIVARRIVAQGDALKGRSALRLLADTGAPARDLERIEASAVELAGLRLGHMMWSGEIALSEEEQAEIEALLAGTGADHAERIEYWRARGLHPLADSSVREASDLVVRLYEAAAAG
jgi:hypothetical protein